MIIRIEYPNTGKLRARKVTSRSKSISTGKHPSWKMGRMMQHESRHELHAFMLLDANPDVLSFFEQPCIIHYMLDGIMHKHFPDILVEFTSGKELWEVKEWADAVDPVVSRRTEMLTAELPAWGFTYRVVLADDLAKQPRLANINKLLLFGNRPVPIIEREQIRQAFLSEGSIPWCSFMEAESLDARYYASRLILEGMLMVNLEDQLTDHSLIYLSNQKKDA
jgi:hypothetical protein